MREVHFPDNDKLIMAENLLNDADDENQQSNSNEETVMESIDSPDNRNIEAHDLALSDSVSEDNPKDPQTKELENQIVNKSEEIEVELEKNVKSSSNLTNETSWCVEDVEIVKVFYIPKYSF